MAAPDWRERWRGLVFAAFFVAVGLVSIVAPVVASWMPLVIIPMSVLLRSAPEVVGADASVE
jgi:energy-converting hydrogenase Eha subunit B